MKLKILQIKETLGCAVSSPDIAASMMAEEAKADRECFWVLHLNVANKIIEKELVSMGTVSNSLVHPREIFKKAIVNGASGIITVHNHPGGQAHPSKDDKLVWDKLDEAGKILGIHVLDHIIITPTGRYYSQKGERMFPEKEVSKDEKGNKLF